MAVSPDDELPQADSSFAGGEGGSGSGGVWPRNQVGDDEDYDRGSGSGDWGGKQDTLIAISLIHRPARLCRQSTGRGSVWGIFH